MIVHVRDFGKIKSADIDLSNLVIFVGENNSGKTYLMQLIYGLLSFFYSEECYDFFEFFGGLEIDEELEIGKKLSVINSDDNEFYKSFQDGLNDFIAQNKEEIVARTFQTRNLSIGSLSVEFEALSDDISLVYEGEAEKKSLVSKRYSIYKNDEKIMRRGFAKSFNESEINNIIKSDILFIMLYELTRVDFIRHSDMRKPFIYLPASRSGIMLLYANYLSNNAKNNKYENEGFVIEDDKNADIENEYGLTEPVYNFLMFLLEHKNSEMLSDDEKSLISFIDNNIISGKIEKFGSAVRYVPENSEQSIPVFLSSSLVSEIAPIYQILSGIRKFSLIMYDEIETCQHPTKQLQLARLLIRMVNKGYRMIVSTHSVTMAAAIDNLITLSHKKGRKELAEKLGYSEEDLLKNSDVHAYQFKIDEATGKTIVEEISSHYSLGVGFDFDIFNKANDKIYQDAVALAEVD